jgi:hypothetical protein
MSFRTSVFIISTWKKCLLEGAQRLFEPGQAQGVNETALTAPLTIELSGATLFAASVSSDLLGCVLTFHIGYLRISYAIL